MSHFTPPLHVHEVHMQAYSVPDYPIVAVRTEPIMRTSGEERKTKGMSRAPREEQIEPVVACVEGCWLIEHSLILQGEEHGFSAVCAQGTSATTC